MCGRYYRQSDKQKIAETFHVARWAPDVHLAPDYNIAPSTFQPIIRSSPEDGEREIVLMRWGLIPEKAADPDSFKTFSTTNARAETILEKPIWKGPFQRSRCLVATRRILRMAAKAQSSAAASDRAWRAWFVRGYCSSSETRCKTKGWLKTGV